ncbi:hypothetical protein BVG16_00065 [Paenibacillus selenitireducens]|uniref:Uncharacterized protein n=1 Tax=Paenibacillus selenitireducens TaxID=1324314 RepID=A0A1T2XLM9_9BACL|nr:hypothetical protein [Paenibacillus selenitireducens]OPA80790.1 hypothetical protein BVG16_00065 [Paenibacillus selenitireducens]
MPKKYVGELVEIIYLSKSGAFTQRKVTISSIKDGIIRAIDKGTGEWRTFREDSIMAWQPVINSAV